MEQRQWGWLVAIAPGAFAFTVEGLVLLVARRTHSEVPARIGFYALCSALFAAVLAPVAISLVQRRDAFMWAVISLGVSFFGLGIGFLFLLLAAVAKCGPGCFD